MSKHLNNSTKHHLMRALLYALATLSQYHLFNVRGRPLAQLKNSNKSLQSAKYREQADHKYPTLEQKYNSVLGHENWYSCLPH